MFGVQAIPRFGATTTKKGRRWAAGLIAALTAGGLVATATPALAYSVTITPGATQTDQNGNQLQMHGLGIIKVGSTYYGFGEDKTGESAANTSFQNIPCYSSTDLGSWSFVREALTRQSTGDLGPSRIVERPKVLYNSSSGQYVMYLHIDNLSYSENRVGVATSPSVCGPYTYRGSFQPLGHRSRDLGLFQDSTGAAYLLSEDPASGLRIDALSSDYLSVTSSVAVLADYEAPAMVNIGGRYYLLGSHLTGWSTNDNQFTTATSLSGPWSSWKSFAPSGTNTCNSQTANIITVQGSSGTTYVYAGDRWNTGSIGASPMVWLPLNISGTSVSISCLSSWSIDAAAGTFSAGSGGGTSSVLTNRNSGLALDVTGASTSDGALIEQWTPNGGANQSWQFGKAATTGYSTLVSVGSGKCLDVPNNSTASGVQLDQWTCNGGTNQEWKQVWIDSTHYELQSLKSGLCADVYGASKTAGAAVIQYTCKSSANQQWSN